MRRTLVVVGLVFGLTILATTASVAWRTGRNLTRQFESRGVAIATSLASSSTETFLFRNVSTIQAQVDQFLDVEGVAYVFVVTPQGEILAHTFVPHVPA